MSLESFEGLSHLAAHPGFFQSLLVNEKCHPPLQTLPLREQIVVPRKTLSSFLNQSNLSLTGRCSHLVCLFPCRPPQVYF